MAEKAKSSSKSHSKSGSEIKSKKRSESKSKSRSRSKSPRTEKEEETKVKKSRSKQKNDQSKMDTSMQEQNQKNYVQYPLSQRPELYQQPECYFHKKLVTQFCDNCQQLTCDQCVQSTHQGHPFIQIQQAFKLRIQGMYSIQHTQLQPKKDQLSRLLHQKNLQMEELEQTYIEIQRDIKREFQQVEERLNNVVKLKKTMLHFSLSELQQDVERLQQLSDSLQDSQMNPAWFLQNQSALQHDIETAIAKPVKQDFELTLQDIPRELDQYRQMVEKYQNLLLLNKAKDELLYRILFKPSVNINQLHKPKSQQQKEEVYQAEEVRQEIQEWRTLIEKYQKTIAKAIMRCQFCQAMLNESSINTQCPNNAAYSSQIEQTLNVNFQFTGSNRHYFVQVDFEKLIQEPLENVYKKIKEMACKKNINLEVMFKDFDRDQSGIISRTEFLYLLWMYFEVPEKTSIRIAEIFDFNKNNTVFYQFFIKELYTKPLEEQILNLKQNSYIGAEMFINQMLGKEQNQQQLQQQGHLQNSQNQTIQNLYKPNTAQQNPYLTAQTSNPYNLNKGTVQILQQLPPTPGRANEVGKKLQQLQGYKKTVFENICKQYDALGLQEITIDEFRSALFKADLGISLQEYDQVLQVVPKSSDGKVKYQEFLRHVS